MSTRLRRHAFLWIVFAIAGGALAAGSIGVSAQAPAKRALTVEDYYRVQSVGGPQFSPDSRWILFSVSTRVEADQATKSESYVVPTDASAQPRRIQHDGNDVTAASWTTASRLQYTAAGSQWTIDPVNPAGAPERGAVQPAGSGAGRGGGGGGGGRGGRGGGDAGGGTASPDGKFTIVLRDKQETRPAAPTRTEFERRHEERFKGVTFDWMEFQRDGQPFPAPNPNLRTAQQVVVQAADGSGTPRILVDRDLRP